MKKKSVPTIQDVAREAGVSASTVSNILNQRWKQTSKETRERILEVARRLNYQPNAMAAALRRRSTKIVGVVVTNIGNPFYAGLVSAIQDEARRAGYNIIVGNTNYDQDLERELVTALLRQQVDGMLVVTNGGTGDLLTHVHSSGTPMVLMDRSDPALDLDSVGVDNEAAAENAVAYLLALGHTRIGIVTGMTTGVPTRAGRLIGYQRALASRGIPVREDYIGTVPTSAEKGREVLDRMLSLDPPPTAFFITNASLALGALEAIRERGLRIPGDTSLLIFDDPEWARVQDPPLTAVAQPTAEIGARAFQLLLQRMTRKRPLERQTLLLPTSLLVRRSCAPPARNDPS